ncbi:MAG TPA: type II toxin-antitoxin system RelE/ParE family toxin [Archangium sp.]|uniref:type II toxin-antitoxin system RelE/ParE family toxin n=1 Tax=Archangium sp. TaxID=1872627 RepID=UPI002E358D9D|nr:type II toxin-antitoxin system RelE/ParE family toxin [Archangium sp.]HEX5744589.1 type II toxin-antitoxin system RelE/ParE family toxin [Archangium sp.]
MNISFYRSKQGNSPVEKYLDDLDGRQEARISAALEDIMVHGLQETTVRRRTIKGKLRELKIDQYRIFYVLVTGPSMVILHACKKQGQKARKEDLDIAKSRMKDVLDAN